MSIVTTAASAAEREEDERDFDAAVADLVVPDATTSVEVPLYSRFEFADIVVPIQEDEEEGDMGAIVAATRKSLGDPRFQVSATASTRTIRIWHDIDFPGRSRLPEGATAAPQSEWRARVFLPDEGERPADQCDLTAHEIVERGGRVIVVIPVTFVRASRPSERQLLPSPPAAALNH